MEQNIRKLYQLMEKCSLCPRNCGVNRIKGEKGACRTAKDFKVASVNLHYGEEPPISGEKGSGTIFFTNCNLACVFCQNFPISQLGNGNSITTEQLADKMIDLQNKGANNINLVTPTHVYPMAAETICIAKQKGLTIPVLSNCGGYESKQVLELMEPFIDIYMPDMKYSSNENAKKYSKIDNYVENNRTAIKEMYRQKGILKFDADGLAVKGILIRHLVLPNNIAGSKEIFNFVATEISQDTYMSVMAQYHTANISHTIEELNRKITPEEYDKVLEDFNSAGLYNGWLQEL
ncbi:MAG: radical SAM protein [Elusimicrobia bacterium]|nr:radical SAM protein [Elusimicrobiota bacterium]